MRLAVQLYTLRGVLGDELEPTLAALAGLGAAEVELAGLHGRSPQEWRRALDAAGLRACARHVPLDQLETDAETALEAVRALGAETVVVPSVPAPASAQEADATVARIAAAARTVAGAGLAFAYHNHDFEFRPLPGGGDLWTRIVAAGLAHEPDVGWLLAAGADPAAVLTGLAGRCPLVHAKDMARAGDGWRDVVVGDGEVDWPAVVAAARDAGSTHLIVELDHPSADALGDLGRCLAALRELL